ncbi:MAG: ABC transporter permease, partial [Christensenellaceae bacterium]
VFIIVIIVGILLLHFLRFGRHIYAVGGNEKAAAASGIHTDRIKIGAYVLAALFAGISGIVLSARLNSASPISGGEYELNAIASVVIGGTSLAGGIGTMAGTLVGIMLLGILTNGLDLLNVSAYLQQVIRGSIIIIATLLDRRTGKMIAGM